MKEINIGTDIRARKNEAGVWELKHPGRNGNMTRWYSSGIRGSSKELRHHIKEQCIEDVIAVGQRGALTEKVLSQFQSGSPKSITLEKVRGEWLEWLRRTGSSPRTVEQYETFLNRWMNSDKKLPALPVSSIAVEHIDPFVNPTNSDIKLATRQTRMNVARSLFKYMIAMNYCAGNPAALVKVRMSEMTHAQKETRHLESFTLEEVKQMVAYIDEDIVAINRQIRTGEFRPGVSRPVDRLNYMQFWRFAVIASFETGLRLGDLAQLEWACFSRPGEIIVWTDKRDKRVAIPYSQFGKWLGESVPKIPCTDAVYCFPEVREKYRKNHSLLSSHFRNMLTPAGVRYRSFHSLRHTAIRRMREEGKSLEEIGELVAHSSPSTTEGYL